MAINGRHVEMERVVQAVAEGKTSNGPVNDPTFEAGDSSREEVW